VFRQAKSLTVLSIDRCFVSFCCIFHLLSRSSYVRIHFTRTVYCGQLVYPRRRVLRGPFWCTRRTDLSKGHATTVEHLTGCCVFRRRFKCATKVLQIFFFLNCLCIVADRCTLVVCRLQLGRTSSAASRLCPVFKLGSSACTDTFGTLLVKLK